ncbi:hypothetical protein K1X76_05930 [bacterium]|nr:hypothetical protein [bacterium]
MIKINNNKGNILRTVLVIVAYITFFIGAFIFKHTYKSKMLRDFPATHTAKQFLLAHPQVAATLGDNIVYGSNLGGSFTYNNQGGDGTIAFPVAGSKANGVIKVTLVQDGNNMPWFVSKAVFKGPEKKEYPLDTPADWLKQAYAALDNLNEKEAVLMCERLKTAVPDDENVTYCESELAFNRYEDHRYIELKRILAEKYPQYARYESELGNAFYELGQPQSAIVYYNKAWDIKPDIQTAGWIAALHLDDNQLDQAKIWLDKAYALGKPTAYIDYLEGLYLLKKNDPKLAISYFNYSREADPMYEYPYFGLATAYQTLGQDTDAVYYYEQGISRKPTGVLKFRKALVNLLIKMKYTDDAIYHLLKIADYHPTDVEGLQKLAQIYDSQGRTSSGDWARQKIAEIQAKAQPNNNSL